jgi:hypothetical protein
MDSLISNQQYKIIYFLGGLSYFYLSKTPSEYPFRMKLSFRAKNDLYFSQMILKSLLLKLYVSLYI